MVAWAWDSQVQFQGIRRRLLASEGTAHTCFVNTWRPKVYRKKVCELPGLTGVKETEVKVGRDPEWRKLREVEAVAV